MFEYMFVELDNPIIYLSLRQTLNKLGGDRWEYAGVIGSRVLMKRQKVSSVGVMASKSDVPGVKSDTYLTPNESL